MGNVHAAPQTPTIATNESTDRKLKPVINQTEEYDVFRDGLLRYIGYTNEIGEAFRRYISRNLYITSYAIATTYVCADTFHKGYRSLQKGEQASEAFMTAGDAFVWQMFASVFIPGYVINRITYLTRRLVRLKRKKCICQATPLVRYSPVIVGLLAIPFIVHPIDDSVTWIMDKTVRKLYKKGDGKSKD